MSGPVSVTNHGVVALITIDNPPVNATSHAVRAGLMAAIEAVSADTGVRAAVLCCAGRTFIAGADITEFGKPPQPPSLPDVYDALEALDKPVVAALHGTALGGGLEAAMSAHYRIATADARFGLPEVKLGLLPGAGGAWRTPRLMGARAALELMLSGQPLKAPQALAAGLIDRIADGEVLDAALGWAAELAAEGAGPRRTADRVPDLAGIDEAWFAAERARVAKTSRGLRAPLAVIDALQAGVSLPPREAQARARALFLELVSGSESAAMRHLFFAEREAAKLPAECRGAALRPVREVAVVGGGTMGAGIAMNFADNGIPVTVLEVDDAAAQRALERMQSTWETSRARGKLDAGELAARLARVRCVADIGEIARADLVVEAVFENLAVKQETFRRLDAVCRPRAILATNTSYQDVNDIAQATSRSGDVVGMHYFSPANVMKLLEVVRARDTSPDVIATVMDLARKLGKIPALVGVCYGFVGNRMLSAWGTQVQMLLLEGAMPAQIDAALEAFGMAMGPCAVGDLAGLDIGFSARRALRHRPDDPRWFRIADMLAESGRLGQKTGAGYYRYDGRVRSVDPEVESMIRAEAARLGIVQRVIPDEEIRERTLYALVNEGCRVLEEGIAQRASDIDLIYVNGYGFPAARGGPMFHARSIGLDRVLTRIRAFAAAHGTAYWEPAPLLVDAVERGVDLP